MRKFFRAGDKEWVNRDLVASVEIYKTDLGRGTKDKKMATQYPVSVRYQYAVPLTDSNDNGRQVALIVLYENWEKAEAKVARFLAGDPE